MALFFISSIGVLLIYVCYCDISKRAISNQVILYCAVVIVAYCITVGKLTHIWHIIPTFIFGFALWGLRVWGAGDAKLLMVLSPAIDFDYFHSTSIFIMVLGGLIALSTWIVHKIFPYHQYGRGVAYGVPISLGCALGIILSHS